MRFVTASIAALAAAAAVPAAAAFILSPVGITSSSNNPFFGDPTVLINHGGLVTPFTSGVTNFDTYIAGNPQHTIFSAGAEWFSDYHTTGATLTLDLGSTYTLDRLAVWNDEYWGVGAIAVSTSFDGVTYTPNVSGLAPTDHPLNSPTTYGADVFALTTTSAHFVKLELSGCPQPDGNPDGGCGLGEIAFSAATPTATPEPAAFAILGIGFVALGALRRRS